MNVFSNTYHEFLKQEFFKLYTEITTPKVKGFKPSNTTYIGPKESLALLFENSKTFYFPNTMLRTDGSLFVVPLCGANIYDVGEEISYILSLNFLTIKKVVLIFNDLRFIYTKFVSAKKICKDYFDRLHLLDIKEGNEAARKVLRNEKIKELKNLSSLRPFSFNKTQGKKIWMRYIADAKGDSWTQIVLAFAINWAKYMERILEDKPKTILSNIYFLQQTAKDVNGYLDLRLMIAAKRALYYTWKYGKYLPW